MKQYLSTALALTLIVLVIALIVVKRGDDAQHESDAGSITDYSNQLSSAQTQIIIYQGTLAAQSNSLTEWQSSALTFSNNLVEAETTNVLDAEQITKLTGQVAEAKSDNPTLEQRLTDLSDQMTNQVASLTKQINSTEAGLEQANKDYALLENRLRRDVAERVLVERRFNNLLELRAQIKKIKENPAEEVSAESFYSDLDVEVNSNGSFHVLAPE
jgi:chromosome segregation ATPase